jgi:hypothetical protein
VTSVVSGGTTSSYITGVGGVAGAASGSTPQGGTAGQSGSETGGNSTSHGGTSSNFVAEIARAIEASDCPDNCPMTTVTASPAKPQASSRGQRVLLIDDGIIFSATTRYATRTLAFLKADEDGFYHEYTPSFYMPQEAYEILKKVDAVTPPLSAYRLNLAQPFADKFIKKLSESWFGHGSDIQAFLAEKVPNLQFVVSESKLEYKDLCGLLDENRADNQWATLESRFTATQKSITELITKYEVNYVHLSWGVEYKGLVRDFEINCKQLPTRAVTDRIQEMYKGLFRAMTALATPGANGLPQPVLLFQAGAAANPPDDYLLDCATIPGRIRVYSSSYTGDAVPLGGSHDYALLSPSELAGRDCNDVYMVMGYESIFGVPRAAYFSTLYLGLGEAPRPTWPPSSSFANPIALAHYICLSKRYPGESATFWMNRLTDSFSKPILDPLLYNEFPINANACTTKE